MFNQDYSDLLRELSVHKVNYVIVGAYAMAAHGTVRATGDIDIFVEPTPANADAVIASLAAFGAPLSGVTADDFKTPGTIYQIGVPPSRIDILTDIDGLSFAEAGVVNVEINDQLVPFRITRYSCCPRIQAVNATRKAYSIGERKPKRSLTSRFPGPTGAFHIATTNQFPRSGDKQRI